MLNDPLVGTTIRAAGAGVASASAIIAIAAALSALRSKSAHAPSSASPRSGAVAPLPASSLARKAGAIAAAAAVLAGHWIVKGRLGSPWADSVHALAWSALVGFTVAAFEAIPVAMPTLVRWLVRLLAASAVVWLALGPLFGRGEFASRGLFFSWAVGWLALALVWEACAEALERQGRPATLVTIFGLAMGGLSAALAVGGSLTAGQIAGAAATVFFSLFVVSLLAALRRASCWAVDTFAASVIAGGVPVATHVVVAALAIAVHYSAFDPASGNHEGDPRPVAALLAATLPIAILVALIPFVRRAASSPGAGRRFLGWLLPVIVALLLCGAAIALAVHLSPPLEY